MVPSPANIGDFSAVCWIFGRRLQQHLRVPVGLVQNQVGGTAVERWSSSAALRKCDQTRGTRMAVCKESPASPPFGADYLAPQDINASQDLNATYYNGMIAPWLPMAVRGAIWYRTSAGSQTSAVAVAQTD